MDSLETNKKIGVENSSEQFLETKSCNHISACTENKKRKKLFAHKAKKLNTQKMTKDKMIIQRKNMCRNNKFSWTKQLSMPKPPKTNFSHRKTYSRVAEKKKNPRGRLVSDPRRENIVGSMSTKHPDNCRALAANCISHAKNSSKNSPLMSNSRNTLKTANKTVERNTNSSKSLRMLSAEDTRQNMSQCARMEPAHNAILDVSTADTPPPKAEKNCRVDDNSQINIPPTPRLRRSSTSGVATNKEELYYMRTCANLLDAWRPIIRQLIVRLPFRTYVYGGEAYQMYWEGNTRSEMRCHGPPFRRASDIDTVVLSNAREWDEVVSDAQKIIDQCSLLLVQDPMLRTLQLQMLPALHARGIMLTHSPILTVRSSPAFFKQDPETGKSALDYERMFYTIMMNVNPYLVAKEKRCCITLLELHVKPRCNWNIDHLSLSRAVLSKYMQVTKILTSTEVEAEVSGQFGIWIPNAKQMAEHANKVIGNRAPHQIAKTRTDIQRLRWFSTTMIHPIAKLALPKKEETAETGMKTHDDISQKTKQPWHKNRCCNNQRNRQRNNHRRRGRLGRKKKGRGNK